jgi:hypothetical protein
MKSVEDLTARLATAEKNWTNLWQSFLSVANLLRTSEDNGRTWGQFIPLILVHLQGFVKWVAHVCIRNILAHVRVLAPMVPLEKLLEEADS